MENLAEEYVKKIEELPEFLRLMELKKIIDSQYGMKIIAFKTKEAKYLEAKENPDYYDMKKITEEFQKAKTSLYSLPEVKEYFLLEARLNQILEEDMNTLKESISNKFTKSNSIKI